MKISSVIWLSLIFLLSSNFVYSTSIQCENVQLTYQRGYQNEFSYAIGGANSIQSFVRGDLPNFSKYIKLNDDNQNGPPRTFSVSLDFSGDIPPGRYKVAVGGIELANVNGVVGGVAAMQCFIKILVLYPGKFLEWGISVSNANINETTNVTFGVVNLGTENISAVYGYADIYDIENKLITRVYSNRQSIASDTMVNLDAKLSTQGFTPGMYTAVGTFFWENNSGTINESKNTTFRIGELNVNIIDYTTEFVINAINKFEVVVLSDWNGGIKDVYALIETPNTRKKPLKTPNIDLVNFQQGVLETYWDTNGLDLSKSEFPVTITIFYSGKITKKQVIVYVNKTGKGEVETPKAFTLFNLSETATIYIIILTILVIILLFNIILIFYKVQSQKNHETRGNYGQQKKQTEGNIEREYSAVSEDKSDDKKA